LLKIKTKTANEKTVFITPGGWYEKKANPDISGFEK